MATIPVKWFHGSMQGAPSWARTPGSFIALLDAVLINGFNNLTLDSLVVSGGVATCTRAAGHGYLLNQVVTIAGATPSALNGEWRVTSIPRATQFTFAVTGVSDGAATGTITAKTSPVGGWTKEFSATNKGVYRSQSSLSPRSYYKVDDTYTVSGSYGRMGRIGAYTSMTDIDTGTGQWGDMSQTGQSFGAPDVASGWQIVADSRTVYVFHWGENPTGDSTNRALRHFRWGDFVSVNPLDVEAEMFFLQDPQYYSYCEFSIFCSSCSTELSIARQSPTLRRDELGALGGKFTGYQQIQDHIGYGGPSFPSPVDGGMMFSNVWLREALNGGHLRGRQRGLLWPLANQPFSIGNYGLGVDISGVAGLEGRIVRILPTLVWGGSNAWKSRLGIDITGPWD
jgi:hypothetical protein